MLIKIVGWLVRAWDGKNSDKKKTVLKICEPKYNTVSQDCDSGFNEVPASDNTSERAWNPN